MRTHFFVIVLCSSIAFAPAAKADDASHRQSVLEFFKLADMESLMNDSIDALLKVQVQNDPRLEPFRPTLKQFLNKYMSWKSLEKDFVDLYVKAFTEPEWKEILTFYRTPVGKKALQQVPRLMQAGAEIGTQRVQQHMPELMQMVQDAAMKQQKAAGAKPAAAPAAAPADAKKAPAPAPQPAKPNK